MDGGIISVMAAILGAFVGGLASLVSTWVSERGRHQRDLLQREISKRENSYSEFIQVNAWIRVHKASP